MTHFPKLLYFNNHFWTFTHMGQFYNIDGTAEINVHIGNSDLMYQ